MLIRANTDGTYSANWTPGAVGLYTIHVTIDGIEIGKWMARKFITIMDLCILKSHFFCNIALFSVFLFSDAGLEVEVKDPPKGMIPPGTQMVKPKTEPQPSKVSFSYQ